MSTTQVTAPGTVTHRGAAQLAGAALVLASVRANAGFTVLGSVFAYPQILEEPTSEILALFREHQTAVVTWFLVLVVGAARATGLSPVLDSRHRSSDLPAYIS